MVGFQTMVIMDLWGMFYHPVVVRVRTFVLLLDLISAYCVAISTFHLRLQFLVTIYSDQGHFHDLAIMTLLLLAAVKHLDFFA